MTHKWTLYKHIYKYQGEHKFLDRLNKLGIFYTIEPPNEYEPQFVCKIKFKATSRQEHFLFGRTLNVNYGKSQ